LAKKSPLSKNLWPFDTYKNVALARIEVASDGGKRNLTASDAESLSPDPPWPPPPTLWTLTCARGCFQGAIEPPLGWGAGGAGHFTRFRPPLLLLLGANAAKLLKKLHRTRHSLDRRARRNANATFSSTD